MDFKTLKEKFSEHANSLLESKDKTARFRANSYRRVANLLDSVDNSIVNETTINELPLTDYMKTKALEIANGKSLKPPKQSKTTKSKTTAKSKSPSRSKSRSKSPSKSPSKAASNLLRETPTRNKLLRELVKFMGIGESRALQLIDDGLKSVNQLHTKKWMAKLPTETQTFLKLKPKKPIPHEDIKILEPYLLKLTNDLTDDSKTSHNFTLKIVGSYRRQKSQSNDIDVMLVSEEDNAIETFLELLRGQFPNKVFYYSKGLDKMSLIIDMNEMLAKTDAVYKLDVFRVTPENEIPMLLYSTGSADHNILMRRIAKQKGMLLNQKGLFLRDSKTKIDNLTSEEDYFKALDLPYKEPRDRI